MQDTELYRHLLGLVTPWRVREVKMTVTEQRIDVWVEHDEGARWQCSECGVDGGLHDHADERVWRHLDSCQFQTFLHARPPRVKCGNHGVKQARLPWAEPRSRFTALFERMAIDVMKEMSKSGACGFLRISWDEADLLMRRAVARGQARKSPKGIPFLGVDEKSVGRGQTYVTVVSDLLEGTVEYVAVDRKRSSLDGFLKGLEPSQLASIEGVAMDMWDPFRDSVVEHVPNGASKVVYDRFHIMKGVNDAVNTVRKRENRRLREEDNGSLVGTKYLWLTNPENLNERQRTAFEALKSLNLETGVAWAMKESLKCLWSYRSKSWALKFWACWRDWVMESNLEPMKRVAERIERRMANILTWFDHRITNAGAEGLNSRISLLQYRARGYRNLENLMTAIHFHLGGLDLYPRTH